MLIKNKKAFFDYHILETFEAGIELRGQEVKSLRSGNLSLAGSYVIIKDREAFWIGADIPPYQPENALSSYNPKRTRKLLLNKKEIKYLTGRANQKTLTLVPLKVYTKKGKIKLEFGLARGKKKSDKRELIRKRESKREIEREMKTRG